MEDDDIEIYQCLRCWYWFRRRKSTFEYCCSHRKDGCCHFMEEHLPSAIIMEQMFEEGIDE